jgi:hypothetical protein
MFESFIIQHQPCQKQARKIKALALFIRICFGYPATSKMLKNIVVPRNKDLAKSEFYKHRQHS